MHSEKVRQFMAAFTAVGAKSARGRPWSVVFTFIGVLIFGIGVPLAGMWFMGPSLRLWLWIGILVLLSAFAVVIGYVIKRRWYGILIDGRNKVSLSKFQIILWFILIISALLAAGLSS